MHIKITPAIVEFTALPNNHFVMLTFCPTKKCPLYSYGHFFTIHIFWFLNLYIFLIIIIEFYLNKPSKLTQMLGLSINA